MEINLEEVDNKIDTYYVGDLVNVTTHNGAYSKLCIITEVDEYYYLEQLDGGGKFKTSLKTTDEAPKAKVLSTISATKLIDNLKLEPSVIDVTVYPSSEYELVLRKKR